MKASKLVFFLLFLLNFRAFSFAQPNERLWVSFGGSSARYIMTIDALGNVVTPPFKVSNLGRFFRPLTALSLNGDNKLNFWFNAGQISREVLDKKSLRSLKLVDTNLTEAIESDTSTLDVTNRRKNNFISFPIDTEEGMRGIAYPLDESGRIIGDGWFLSPPLSPELCGNDTNRCKGGTAANGRVAYWIEKNSNHPRRTDLFIQPLGPRGRPILEPIFIDRIISHTSQLSSILSADATTILSGKKRFLVYTKEIAERRDTVLLQHIDAVTGNKIGEAITLFRGDVAGNLKIDPKGRFVLFSGADSQIGGGLVYLALDAIGHASGSPKILTDLAFVGIGFLREKLE